eukprot:TRINITY_DN1154_c0_g1_i1.p1 TRINITY_DN1154_c0_g1~~TRINITY_DN1154_c0_g1_i1.p1  ORF type:complete len:441 (-),score=82.13 TRINITY_DN1154_c0_g1_i1:25-1347(-)
MSRESSTYTPNWDRFKVQNKTFDQQYAPLYSHRLIRMKSQLLEKAIRHWRDDVHDEPPIKVKRILEIKSGKLSIVAGTLYKEMPLRPNILESYAKERSIIPPQTRSNYVSDKDVLILEDDSGRIKLLGDSFCKDSLVTGIVVVVKGIGEVDGDFQVQKIFLSGLPSQIPRSELTEPNHYVAFISGLKIGDSHANLLPFQLFLDYVTGHIGSENEQEFQASIIRVIICGNSLVEPEESAEGISFLRNQTKELSSRHKAKIISPIKDLDFLLSQLASSVEVDLLPGNSDPANFTLPQQPLNRCLFPSASLYSSFHLAPNPYEGKIGDTMLLGTSGQNIDDIRKYSKLESSVTIMEQTLKWQHLAPTAPDTLGCYPFYSTDPFIIENTPHIYFAGNQPAFETKIINEGGKVISLVSIPSFSSSQTAVLVNLKTLQASQINFSV